MAKARVAERSTGESARGRARRRGRGRVVVAALLVGFVLVASAVIWRRSYGVTLSRDLAEIDRRRVQLESERVRLHGAIEDEASRSRLEPVVARLGMRVPSDKQVRILTR